MKEKRYKSTEFFSHDSNARGDEKLVELRIKHGWEGYGLYWALIEKLRSEREYETAYNLAALAYELRTTETLLKSIIEDFKLFKIVNGFFHSESLRGRMRIAEETRIKLSDAGRRGNARRWSNRQQGDNLPIQNQSPPDSDSVAGQSPADGEAIAPQSHPNRNIKENKKEKGNINENENIAHTHTQFLNLDNFSSRAQTREADDSTVVEPEPACHAKIYQWLKSVLPDTPNGVFDIKKAVPNVAATEVAQALFQYINNELRHVANMREPLLLWHIENMMKKYRVVEILAVLTAMNNDTGLPTKRSAYQVFNNWAPGDFMVIKRKEIEDNMRWNEMNRDAILRGGIQRKPTKP